MKGIERFFDKAEKYELYRPAYTEESLMQILDFCGVSPDDKIKVADIGSGTGKFTQLLLNKGFYVYAVEPNDHMRHIAERKFSDYDNFVSICNTAENTNLNDNCISLITVAQAFHYFDLDEVKKEFMRILKPDGKVALLWNFRSRESEFIQEYENIIYSLHSGNVKPTHAQDNMTEEIFEKFFENYEIVNLSNSQEFGFEDLWGRTLSNNHMPKENEPEYIKLYNSVSKIFDRYQENGKVLFPYRTQVVVGDFGDDRQIECLKYNDVYTKRRK